MLQSVCPSIRRRCVLLCDVQYCQSVPISPVFSCFSPPSDYMTRNRECAHTGECPLFAQLHGILHAQQNNTYIQLFLVAIPGLIGAAIVSIMHEIAPQHTYIHIAHDELAPFISAQFTRPYHGFSTQQQASYMYTPSHPPPSDRSCFCNSSSPSSSFPSYYSSYAHSPSPTKPGQRHSYLSCHDSIYDYSYEYDHESEADVLLDELPLCNDSNTDTHTQIQEHAIPTSSEHRVDNTQSIRAYAWTVFCVCMLIAASMSLIACRICLSMHSRKWYAVVAGMRRGRL